MTGGIGLVAAATFDPFARAEPPGATEKANIKLVQDFIAALQDPKADFPALLNHYLAPNVSVRWVDTQPAVYGPRAALIQLMANYPKDATFSISIP